MKNQACIMKSLEHLGQIFYNCSNCNERFGYNKSYDDNLFTFCPSCGSSIEEWVDSHRVKASKRIETISKQPRKYNTPTEHVKSLEKLGYEVISIDLENLQTGAFNPIGIEYNKLPIDSYTGFNGKEDLQCCILTAIWDYDINIDEIRQWQKEDRTKEGLLKLVKMGEKLK